MNNQTMVLLIFGKKIKDAFPHALKSSLTWLLCKLIKWPLGLLLHLFSMLMWTIPAAIIGGGIILGFKVWTYGAFQGAIALNGFMVLYFIGLIKFSKINPNTLALNVKKLAQWRLKDWKDAIDVICENKWNRYLHQSWFNTILPWLFLYKISIGLLKLPFSIIHLIPTITQNWSRICENILEANPEEVARIEKSNLQNKINAPAKTTQSKRL